MLGPFATASRRMPPVLHCHSPGVATVARRLCINVHNNNDNNNDNAWQRGPLWPHGMGPITCAAVFFWQDCDVKAALHDVPNVFEVLLELIYSEYPVIQHQALVALSLAAENGVHWCTFICRHSLIALVLLALVSLLAVVYFLFHIGICMWCCSFFLCSVVYLSSCIMSITIKLDWGRQLIANTVFWYCKYFAAAVVVYLSFFECYIF